MPTYTLASAPGCCHVIQHEAGFNRFVRLSNQQQVSSTRGSPTRGALGDFIKTAHEERQQSKTPPQLHSHCVGNTEYKGNILTEWREEEKKTYAERAKGDFR